MFRDAALSDLRVLDLTGPIGWYATRLLADLGAEVIRIDPPQVRATPDSNWYNAGKRLSAVDLGSARGLETARALAAGADVIVETTALGYLEARGIDTASLRRANPQIIFTSITPFGRTGPRSGWRGTDLIGLAAGGLAHLAGCAGSPPTHLGGDQGYLHAGLVAAAATLIALRARDRYGIGQDVDVSLQDTVVFTNENAVGLVDLMGIRRARLGHRFFAGDRLFFRTLDGWVVTRLGNRWDSFLDWLAENGEPTDVWTDPRWLDNKYRDRNFSQIGEVLSRVAARTTKADFSAGLQRRRIVASPVKSAEDLGSDVQLIARDFWLEVEEPAGRMVRYPGAPFKMSATPWRVRTWESGTLGERTASGLAPPSDDLAWSTPITLQDKHSANPISPDSPAERTSMSDAARLPLEGLRVLDLTWVIAGPGATQVLADHGADVLKIESATRLDSLRVQVAPRQPWEDGINHSGMFSLINSSKRSVALNLTTNGGQKLLRRLLRLADIIVDNYGVDPMPKWGLTEEAIRAINPDVIIARSSVMGRSGPNERAVGLGYTIGPNAGLNLLSGFPEDPPVGPCTALPDYSSNPYHLVAGILAALHYRERTGKGQTIDLSQHESTVVFNGPAITAYSRTGELRGPTANRSSVMCPHGTYPCRGEDRWVAIACETDEDWQRLAKAIERLDLAAEVQLNSLAGRKAREDELDSAIAQWTCRMTPAEAATLLQCAGVPASAVQDASDLIRDPHLAARSQLVRVVHPEMGTIALNGPSFRLSATPGRIRRYPPVLGEDSEDVLRDLLGLDEEQLVDCYVEGVVQ